MCVSLLIFFFSGKLETSKNGTKEEPSTMNMETVSSDKSNENDSSNLNKSSGSDDHTAAIAKLNVASDMECQENVKNNSSNVNNKENNNASNAAHPVTSVSEPICNGHSNASASQLCRDQSSMETELVDRGGEGEKVLPDSNKDNGGTSGNPVVLNAEGMSVGAGESLVENSVICEGLVPRLVNSVSVDSYDDVEDMQTEGTTENSKYSEMFSFK